MMTNRETAEKIAADAHIGSRLLVDDIAAALDRKDRVTVLPASADTFQDRVEPWLMECFGEKIAADRGERNHRFLEEALELVQVCGCTQSEAHQIVDYVYGRPAGFAPQEVGGVMVTLAALCLAQGNMDMHVCGEEELTRILAPATMARIRAKQAAKPAHSPLPEYAVAPADWIREAAKKIDEYYDDLPGLDVEVIVTIIRKVVATRLRNDTAKRIAMLAAARMSSVVSGARTWSQVEPEFESIIASCAPAPPSADREARARTFDTWWATQDCGDREQCQQAWEAALVEQGVGRDVAGIGFRFAMANGVDSVICQQLYETLKSATTPAPVGSGKCDFCLRVVTDVSRIGTMCGAGICNFEKDEIEPCQGTIRTTVPVASGADETPKQRAQSFNEYLAEQMKDQEFAEAYAEISAKEDRLLAEIFSQPSTGADEATQTKLNNAVWYALKEGCFHPVPEPRPGATVEELIQHGAMRNLHDAMAEAGKVGLFPVARTASTDSDEGKETNR